MGIGLDGNSWTQTFLFINNHANIAVISPQVAKKFCWYLGMPLPFYNSKARLYRWVDWILKDEKLILQEGVKKLSLFELIEAN